MAHSDTENRDSFGTGNLLRQAVDVPDRAFNSHRKTSGVGTASYETNLTAPKEALACSRGPGDTHSSAQFPPCSPEMVVG